MNSISLLIGLSVIENVTAQYLFEAYSESLTKDFDQSACGGFVQSLGHGLFFQKPTF